jgi:hypothetical protein
MIRNKRTAVELEVKQLLRKDPNLTGKRLQYLIEEEQKECHGIHLTVRTYQNIKKDVMPQIEAMKAKGLDQTWNLGISSLDIPVEAIPYIFEVQKWLRHKKLDADPFTIRQARWIARLCLEVKGTELLWRISYIYSLREIISQLRGEAVFDTSEMDKAIQENKFDPRTELSGVDESTSFEAFSKLRQLE